VTTEQDRLLAQGPRTAPEPPVIGDPETAPAPPEPAADSFEPVSTPDTPAAGDPVEPAPTKDILGEPGKWSSGGASTQVPSTLGLPQTRYRRPGRGGFSSLYRLLPFGIFALIAAGRALGSGHGAGILVALVPIVILIAVLARVFARRGGRGS
jgi:hypothetical protein